MLVYSGFGLDRFHRISVHLKSVLIGEVASGGSGLIRGRLLHIHFFSCTKNLQKEHNFFSESIFNQI